MFVQMDEQGNVCGTFNSPQPDNQACCEMADDDPRVVAFLESQRQFETDLVRLNSLRANSVVLQRREAKGDKDAKAQLEEMDALYDKLYRPKFDEAGNRVA